ncbi:MAG: metal-dependent phosphohydrolase [Acidobacteria bacterium]|jgi:putative two-component system response regulator|nr:MAG: metal-dependent phosphohydrolase [Acidobacteriota bacterium]
MNLRTGQRWTTLSSKPNSYQSMGDILTGRRKPSILVVDDHPQNVMVMTELLLTRGYRITSAQDATSAEAEIRRDPPDLILLDVIMPGKTGYELCRQLKDDPLTRLIPIVMITGLSAREDRLQGIEAGADDFLSKPINPEELFARASSLLKLKEFTDELETAESVICTLGLSVESRDPYTEGHCDRLASNAAEMGRHLSLDQDSIVALRRGGYLHDLGKIAVPDEILKKGSNLTPAEWEIMKKHPVTGEKICRPLKSLRLVLPIIRSHHEHSDGSGYPDGLRDGEIPLLPRILQVVDVYDALRTARPYKPALSHEQASVTMRDESRSGLWDQELVREFFRMLDKRSQVA